MAAASGFLFRGGYVAPDVTITVLGRISSGLPFTPTMSGDLNGDEFANDRAFIFAPSPSGAPVARSLNALLAGSSSPVRECLLRQQNTPAARNSCEGLLQTVLHELLRAVEMALEFRQRLVQQRLYFRILGRAAHGLGVLDVFLVVLDGMIHECRVERGAGETL